jgi:hypothetical protein
VIQELVEALGNLGGQELGVQPRARVAITRRHGLRLPIRSWDKRIPATFILIGVDVQDVDDVAQALMEIGNQQALDAWAACTSRPDNTMGSVYGTAETLLDVYGDPVIAQSAEGCDLDLDELVTGANNTLYLYAPASEQERLRPLFELLVSVVIYKAEELAAAQPGFDAMKERASAPVLRA